MSEKEKTVFDHLRETAFHKLKAWDASVKAEKQLGMDIDTEDDDFAHNLSAIETPEDALALSDDAVLGLFGLGPDECPECGGEFDRDCMGLDRCSECDEPCPCCDDGGGPTGCGEIEEEQGRQPL